MANMESSTMSVVREFFLGIQGSPAVGSSQTSGERSGAGSRFEQPSRDGREGKLRMNLWCGILRSFSNPWTAPWSADSQTVGGIVRIDPEVRGGRASQAGA